MYIYRVTNETKNTKLSNDDKEYIINEINDLDFNYVEIETIYGHIYEISYGEFNIVFQGKNGEYINVKHSDSNAYYVTKNNTSNLYKKLSDLI